MPAHLAGRLQFTEIRQAVQRFAGFGRVNAEGRSIDIFDATYANEFNAKVSQN